MSRPVSAGFSHITEGSVSVCPVQYEAVFYCRGDNLEAD